jgi:type IV pilus assembly protein PilY1
MTSAFCRSSTVVSSIGAIAAICLGLWSPAALATTAKLSDQPVFASSDVPGNLALALSVEYPTAISVANLNDYADATEYLGYFDPRKCYTYTYVAPAVKDGAASASYFQPAGASTGTNKHTCSGQWSGNFMNWATMQTIDPFRWALSGGYRSVDTTSETILEKAWGSAQGFIGNFPLRGTDQGNVDRNNCPSRADLLGHAVRQLEQLQHQHLVARQHHGVHRDRQPSNGSGRRPEAMSALRTRAGSGRPYQVYVRVKVCDPRPVPAAWRPTASSTATATTSPKGCCSRTPTRSATAPSRT